MERRGRAWCLGGLLGLLLAGAAEAQSSCGSTSLGDYWWTASGQVTRGKQLPSAHRVSVPPGREHRLCGGKNRLLRQAGKELHREVIGRVSEAALLPLSNSTGEPLP